MESGFDLLLCAHHFHENETRLREVAVMIHDESERLVDHFEALTSVLATRKASP